MPIFQYTVRDQTGAVRTGTSEAESEEILTFRLYQQGFVLENIQQSVYYDPVQHDPSRRLSKVRVARTDVLVFWIQFSIMIDAHVARWRALDIAAERAASHQFKNVITDIANRVMGGTPLHQAMAFYPGVFDAASVGIIHAGEAGNALPDAVHRLIQFLERDRRRPDRG